MSLIKCSECGYDISEKASVCPKCGCPVEITKQIIDDNKKKRKKRNIIIGTSIIALIIIIIILVGVIKYCGKPGSIAVRLIKKDFGRDIKVEEIYYNSEVNGCLVKFSVNGKKNTATVHLEDKTVGYQSVLDEYTEKSDKATTDEEKKQIAEDMVAYMKVYDIFWEYNILTQGEEKSNWEQIE